MVSRNTQSAAAGLLSSRQAHCSASLPRFAGDACTGDDFAGDAFARGVTAVPCMLAGAGNVWVNTGDERLDVGLCVKHGPKSMCVPDYVQAQPDSTGWTYSQALLAVITQYKVYSTCVWTALICNAPLTTDHAQSRLLQQEMDWWCLQNMWTCLNSQQACWQYLSCISFMAVVSAYNVHWIAACLAHPKGCRSSASAICCARLSRGKLLWNPHEHDRCGAVQSKHSWVFAMLEGESDSGDYQLSHVFPGMSKEEALKKVKQVKAWLQGLPLAKRPLVKVRFLYSRVLELMYLSA